MISGMEYKDRDGNWKTLTLPSAIISSSLENQINSLREEIASLTEIIAGLQAYAESE